MVGIGYVNSRLKTAYRLSGKKPLVLLAWSRSRPLLKNLGIAEVVMTTPFGWENSRMSRARRKVWIKEVVRRLSGGEEIVRR